MQVAEVETDARPVARKTACARTAVAPEISVIIPCRNESNWVLRVLEDLAQQTFDEPFEVLVADGESDDGTWELLQDFQRTAELRYELSLLRNRQHAISNALNLLVEHARGKYIVRVDAHSRIPREYLERIVKTLKSGVCDVAGPRIQFIPASGRTVSRVIAAVCNTRMGNGGTPSRTALKTCVRVDHTVMSCFTRRVWEHVGGYDQALKSNEDFDYDFRAAKAGFRVLSLPNPVYMLVARADLSALIRQRWRYGFWKAHVLRKFPMSLKFRQLLPILVLPAALLLAFCPAYLALAGALYLLLIAASLDRNLLREQGLRPIQWAKVAALSVVVMLIVHFVWSAGVWRGLFHRNSRT
ncbi:MAG TPA: glycosyltransferase [Planctomycetota bacterium]|jgi:glycosyltransferase involved in cell wall biosynthesis